MARLALILAFLSFTATAEAGRACRGGPGFRLPDGRCASWKQHETHSRRGGYPQGTVDERGLACASTARDPGRQDVNKDRQHGRKKKAS